MRRILCAAILFSALTVIGCDTKPTPADADSQTGGESGAASGAGDNQGGGEGGAERPTANGSTPTPGDAGATGEPDANRSSTHTGGGGTGTGVDTTAIPTTASADASLEFITPEGWIEEPPASGSRVKQYVLPAAEAGATGGSVVVYYFGSGGAGAIDANVDRWIGQFEQPDGSASADKAGRSQMTIKGMNVTLVAVEGTYVAAILPGSAERFNERGYAMLAAIMESDHGPYFIKLLGPATLVNRWEESYHEFLNNVRTPE